MIRHSKWPRRKIAKFSNRFSEYKQAVTVGTLNWSHCVNLLCTFLKQHKYISIPHHHTRCIVLSAKHFSTGDEQPPGTILFCCVILFFPLKLENIHSPAAIGGGEGTHETITAELRKVKDCAVESGCCDSSTPLLKNNNKDTRLK